LDVSNLPTPTEFSPSMVTDPGGASRLFDPSAVTTKAFCDVATGDCFDEPIGDVEDTEWLVLRACSEPHDNEIFATLEIPGNDWPGFDTVDHWSDAHCLQAFEPYVGTRYESSALEIAWYFPLEQSWVKYDDRTVSCILFDASLEKMSSSMKGSSI
jgi:hypothetical protein